MLCCSCLDNILPKTIVFVLTAVLLVLGLASTAIGAYTYAKHQNDSFFDAYLVDGFNSTEAITYIGELRLGANASDIPGAFDKFADQFEASFIRETLVKHAFKPKSSDAGNLELSYFLEGFRDSAICKSDCQRGDRTSAEIIADFVNAQTAGIDAIAGVIEDGVNLGVDGVESANKLREKAADITDDRRRVDGSLKPSDTAERRRSGNPSEEEGNEDYASGYDTAQVIKDFQVNWIIFLVFGAVLLVMGAITCKALTNRCVALLLAVLLAVIGLFCFLQYGQSQGWEACEKMLSHINFGGVIMKASDDLRKNETADLAISSLMGFYKPYYLLIGSIIALVLSTMFLKLAFCANLAPEKGNVFASII